MNVLSSPYPTNFLSIFFTLFPILFLILSKEGGGPVLICFPSINKASEIPHSQNTFLSKVFISWKSIDSPNSWEARFALS